MWVKGSGGDLGTLTAAGLAVLRLDRVKALVDVYPGVDREDEMVTALVDWAEFIHEHGVDAALARVDLEKARHEAERDRAALLAEQGDDVNASEVKVELIHTRVD